MLMTLNDMAMTLQRQGKYEEALLHFQRALAVGDRAQETFPNFRFHLAYNYGQLLAKVGRY